MHLTVYYLHVTYAFQSVSTLYICLIIKKHYAQNRNDIWTLSYCKGTRICNHRVWKERLNHLVNHDKWVSWVVSTYLHGAFDLCYHHVTYAFQSASTLYICLIIKELYAQNRHDIWRLSYCKRTRICNNIVTEKEHWTISPIRTIDWAELWVLICTVHLTLSYHHVTYAFHSESTLYGFLNVKELLTWNSHHIWGLSDCNKTRTHNH